MTLYSTIRPLIFSLPPETSHNLAIRLLNRNLILPSEIQHFSNLNQEICGLPFQNPVGLAAGFTKNAEGISNLSKLGFGFIEAGTVTPKAQIGNPKPRIFRLKKHEAVINRLGFNNLGKEVFRQNVSKQEKEDTILGINIGKNKDSADYLADYVELLEYFYPYADYITINISSPNTPNLRDIQKAENLDIFIEKLMQKRQELTDKYSLKRPLFLKIAPDQSEETLSDICQISQKRQIDALIISNTTITRPKYLTKKQQQLNGGLSGKPLFSLSTKILREVYQETKGHIPLIGVGGISSAEEAYQKILAGASLIQLYTALIYQGFGLIGKINQEISQRLKADGFKNISEAIGKES